MIVQAIKLIYPEIQGGYVYWETKKDGAPLDNPIDGLVWENTEFTKPTWAQIKAKLLIVNLQKEQDLKIVQLKKNRAEKAEFSTVEYNSKTYSNSQNARNVITGRIAITTNASPARFYQTYPVVEIVHLSRPDFVAIANLIDENESSLRAAEIGLINEIKACTAISEIDLIKIEF